MSQIAQLSEAEIEERFHIAGSRPIAFLLAGFARDSETFSVQCGTEGHGLLTTLLAAQAEKDLLVFDCSGSEQSNRQLLRSEHNVFVGRPGGIHVQFTTGQAREVVFGGSRAFAVRLPEFVVRRQRRDYFRIEAPRVRPLQFFGRLPDGGLLNVPIHDISVAGIGVAAPVLPDSLVPGLFLDRCHFSLPEDEHDLVFRATVRHVTERDERSGKRWWCVGLQFGELAGSAEARIQRYITQIERERHDLA
ncbi:MAG: flagellar brake protein [Betaproteobacteria bacterium]|nr:flagellar brake protein [Betaproteobacteria bacterium]